MFTSWLNRRTWWKIRMEKNKLLGDPLPQFFYWFLLFSVQIYFNEWTNGRLWWKQITSIAEAYKIVEKIKEQWSYIHIKRYIYPLILSCRGNWISDDLFGHSTTWVRVVKIFKYLFISIWDLSSTGRQNYKRKWTFLFFWAQWQGKYRYLTTHVKGSWNALLNTILLQNLATIDLNSLH